jgi:5-formyltetrahydrofolate cyclo-ligase
VIHIYLPILDNHEIDTFPIVEYLRLNFESIQIAVPKVAPLNALKHYLLIDDTTLEPNMWGIPEPTNAVPIREDQIDLVVVPMIIFDRSGHRVGYGKGYYDRFLAKCRPDARKIGLCYFNPVKRIDTDPTDISMDVVVTPDGIWEFGDKPGINHS